MAPKRSYLHKVKREITVFCEATGLHGFAYAVSGRNRVETVFWIAVVLISLIGAGIIIYDAFKSWTETPVVSVIKSFKHDTSQMPAPAITICPKQYLDELYHVSVLLNQLDFRCMATPFEDITKYESVNPCNESHIEVLRANNSHFYTFLEELKGLVRAGVSRVEGEIDWVSHGIKSVPMNDGPVKDLLIEALYKYADYNAVPRRPTMPLDEDKWTLNYLDFVVEAVAQYYINFNKPDGETIIPDQRIFTFSNYDYLHKPHEQIEYLEKTKPAFEEIGHLRGLKFRSTLIAPMTPGSSNGTGIDVAYDIWRDMIKSMYFTQRFADVGLGSLFRHYLPHLFIKELPFGMEIDREALETIAANLSSFASEYMTESPIDYSLVFDNRGRSANKYFTQRQKDLEEDVYFTEEAIPRLLRGIRFSLISSPFPDGDLIEKEFAEFFTIPGENKQHDYSNMEITWPEVESYETPHFFDDVATDIYSNPVYAMLELEAAVGEAVAAIMKQVIMGVAEPTLHPIRAYQVGRAYDGLNMVLFCSQGAMCPEYLRQAPTGLGLCSVLDGMPLEGILKENAMLSFLHRFFTLPTAQNAPRSYSDISSMAFLLDIHNRDIKKALYSEAEGYFSITIGAPDKYLSNFGEYIVSPGETSLFKVSTQLQTSDEDIRSYAPDQRLCLFEDENPIGGSFFRKYTKDTCQYECALEGVQEELDTDCVPWDIPYPFELGKTRICNGQAAKEFKEELVNVNVTKYKDCFDKCGEQCESSEYFVQLDTIKTDVTLACKDLDYFQHVQNAEQQNEFTSALSVTQRYLNGETSQMKYCQEKMSTDIAIVKFQLSSIIVVRANNERSSTVLDQIGMIGGSMGLFNGCSLMVSMELVQLLIFAITALKSKSESTSSREGYVRILLEYLVSSTIHGLQYIHTTNYLVGKILWLLITVFFLVAGSTLSAFAFFDFRDNQVTRSMEILGRDIREVAYPTITICPVQYNDNWNLVQGLLNTRALRDPATGDIDLDTLGVYKEFFEMLVAHLWLHESDIAPGAVKDEALFQKLLPYFVFNRDTETLARNLALRVLNNDLDGLYAFEGVDVGGVMRYELDWGQEVEWRSLVIRGDLDLVKAIHGSVEAADLKDASLDTSAMIPCSFYSLKISADMHQLVCKAPMKSRYIYAISEGSLDMVGPVAFSTKCREKETDIDLEGVYWQSSCYYENKVYGSLCPFETQSLDIEAANVFINDTCSNGTLIHEYVNCSERMKPKPDMSMCIGSDPLELYYLENWSASTNSVRIPDSISICNDVSNCITALKRLWQLMIWYRLYPTKLGTMFHYFSETAVRGIFHPAGTFKENRLLLTQREIEIKLLKGFTEMLSNVFGADIDMTMIEIPPLLEAPIPSNRRVTPTNREIGSRHLHYALMKPWEEEEFGEKDPSYSFYFANPQRTELPFEANAYEGLITDIFKGAQATMKNASHMRDLQSTVGEAFIKTTYDSHYFSHALSGHLLPIMKVMRFSQVLGNVFAAPSSLTELFGDSWHFKDYSSDDKQGYLRDFTEVLLTTGKLVGVAEYLENEQRYAVDPTFWADNTWTRLEMLRHCRFADVLDISSECRESFHHVLTEKGVCSAFNSVALDSLYKESVYTKEITRLYNTAIATEEDVFLIPGTGINHRLSLILDVHHTDVFGTESGYFSLGINSFWDVFSMSAAFEVYPGQETNVYVRAIAVDSEDDVQGIVDIEDRYCRYRDEPLRSSSPFKHYTQKGCQVGCQIEKAKDHLGCIPWNIVHRDDELGSPICTRFQVEAFDELLSNSSFDCIKGCMENCVEVIYDYSVDRMVIDPNVACSDDSLLLMPLLGINERHDLFRWEYLRRNLWYFSRYQEHLLLTEHARCIQKVSLDYGFVNVVIDSDTASVSTMSRKYDYVDQLAIIGGTMGLWTGFSLISAVELSFWLLVVITYKAYREKSWVAMPGG